MRPNALHEAPEVKDFPKPRQNLFGEVRGETVLENIGFIPSSVWADRPGSVVKIQMPQPPPIKPRSVGLVEDRPYSHFPLTLARRCIALYGYQRRHVLDPFAGWGTRAYAALERGLSYEGYEIVPAQAANLWAWLSEEWPKGDWTIRNGDGTKLVDTPAGIADYLLTCPPYWNVEVYESVEGQLSDAKSYSEFLAAIKATLAASRECLKPGALATWVVGTIKQGKAMLPFPAELCMMAVEMGYGLHDWVIWAYDSATLRGIGGTMSSRRAMKTHDDVITFRRDV